MQSRDPSSLSSSSAVAEGSAVTSEFFVRVQGIISTLTSSWQHLPVAAQASILIGLPVCGYVTYQQYRRSVVTRRAEEHCKKVMTEIQGWRIWELEDRLYSMGDATPQQLGWHRSLSQKVDYHSQALAKWGEEIDGFVFLKKWEGLRARVWDGQDRLVAGSLQHTRQVLNTTGAALTATDALNRTLLSLKKRLYIPAKRSANITLDKLKEWQKLALQDDTGIDSLPFPALYGQAYNIAAKVARVQDDYVTCDNHYEQATKQLSGLSELFKVQGSHCALWGDIIWGLPAVGDQKATQALLIRGFPREKVEAVFSALAANAEQIVLPPDEEKSSGRPVVGSCPERPAFLKQLLNGSLVQQFRQQRYSLGLTNLSWILIRAAERELSKEQRTACLRQAEKLADEAIKYLEEQPQALISANAMPTETSSNAWLFRGIARVEQAELMAAPVLEEKKSHVAARPLTAEQRELYAEALIDFNLGLQLSSSRDHPSLLRRRALVLDRLGEVAKAYDAYREAQIELICRRANGELIGLQSTWLDKIKDTLSTYLSQHQLTPNKDHEVITDSLIKTDYGMAYYQLGVLRHKNPQDTWAKERLEWFHRHFKVDTATQQVLPIARENLLARLELLDAPSPYMMMELSAATYRAKHGRPVLDGVPSGWAVLSDGEKVAISSTLLPQSKANGYLAVAFQHISSGQIVISHGGTDWTDPKDLWADVSLAWGGEYPQLKNAQDFTEAALTMANTLAARSQPGALLPLPSIIYHTGHSLGGALAAYVACTSAPMGSQYAITFDNPSSYRQIADTLRQNPKLSWYTYQQNFPVTSYLTRPTFINCAGGPHVGRTLRLEIDRVNARSLSDELSTTLITRVVERGKKYFKEHYPGLPIDDLAEWGSVARDNVACHGCDFILSGLVTGDGAEHHTRKPVQYVLNWPEDLRQWHAFECAMQAEELAGDDILHYLPPESPPEEKSTYRYRLRASTVGIAGTTARESIPLMTLESEMAAVLKELLKEGPLSVEKFRRCLDGHILSPKQQGIAEQLDPYVVSCLELNEDQDAVLLKGELSSWQLFTYLRQQVHEACRSPDFPHAAAEILYPDLAHLPGQKTLPMLVRPSTSVPTIVTISTTLAATETTPLGGQQGRKLPVSHGTFGTFFVDKSSEAKEVKKEAKNAGTSASNRLSNLVAPITEARPASSSSSTSTSVPK